jgi:hypothetical protein
MIGAGCGWDCRSNEDDDHERVPPTMSGQVEQKHEASEEFLPLVKSLSRREQKKMLVGEEEDC